MAHDDYIINRKTQSVLDMGGGFHGFCSIASHDRAWVTDRELLVVVMTEALENLRKKYSDSMVQRTVESHAQRIWCFVQGAKPQDIEFSSDVETLGTDTLDHLKKFALYGGVYTDHFIVNHRSKSMFALGKDNWFHSWAGHDMAWVLDQTLTQVVVEEARGKREGESEASVRELAERIWGFVKGAKPEEIELLIEGECERYRGYSVV